jgi:hypothetical protein
VSIPRIPVTASSPVEWIRRASGSVNALISSLTGLGTRTTTLETGATALAARTTALEAFAHVPFTVASITLTPAALPGSPVKGMIVYDIADDKVKAWNGAIWNALY